MSSHKIRKGKTRGAIELEARDRALRVLELRRAGLTFERIAAELGYADRGGAHKAYRQLMDARESESVAETRTLGTERMESLISANWVRARKGDRDAAEVVMSAQREISKLHGAYAPIKQALTDPEGNAVPHDPYKEILARLQRIAEAKEGEGKG